MSHDWLQVTGSESKEIGFIKKSTIVALSKFNGADGNPRNATMITFASGTHVYVEEQIEELLPALNISTDYKESKRIVAKEYKRAEKEGRDEVLRLMSAPSVQKKLPEDSILTKAQIMHIAFILSDAVKQRLAELYPEVYNDQH